MIVFPSSSVCIVSGAKSNESPSTRYLKKGGGGGGRTSSSSVGSGRTTSGRGGSGGRSFSRAVSTTTTYSTIGALTPYRPGRFYAPYYYYGSRSNSNNDNDVQGICNETSTLVEKAGSNGEIDTDDINITAIGNIFEGNSTLRNLNNVTTISCQYDDGYSFVCTDTYDFILNETTTTCTERYDESNTGAVVGVTIALILLLLGLPCCFIYFRNYHRRKNFEKEFDRQRSKADPDIGVNSKNTSNNFSVPAAVNTRISNLTPYFTSSDMETTTTDPTTTISQNTDSYVTSSSSSSSPYPPISSARINNSYVGGPSVPSSCYDNNVPGAANVAITTDTTTRMTPYV